jgi:uncharacterized protein YaiI (UPF0178 family)
LLGRSLELIAFQNKNRLIFLSNWDKYMQIWVDADACPKAVKDILFRVAERTKIMTTLVANQSLHIPASRNIAMLQVTAGFDVADNEIVKRLRAGDLVITGDIPLAAQVLEKGGHAINPRGERYSQDTIKERLNMRDFMDTLRSSGIQTGGPAALSSRDIQAFANQLDTFLARQKIENKPPPPLTKNL